MLRGPSITELTAILDAALPPSAAAASQSEEGQPEKEVTGSTAESVTPPHVERSWHDNASRTGKWLVTQRSRSAARMRLFCFPFAGGGSAVFDSWGDAFGSEIEVVSVEAPGRLGRINEKPVRTVEAFARGLLPELVDQLDRPYAVLGHCLGGLTLYETLRFLQARRHALPVHIFISGARPPNALRAPGDFERDLGLRLRAFADYRSGRPGHEQSDAVFSEIIRAFGISQSSRMLDDAELRDLILPTVRAEFEMVSSYVYLPEDPFPVPITCFRGSRDEYFRAIDARMWRRFTSRQFEVFERDTGHFAIVEDFDFVREIIEERLAQTLAEIT